MCTLLSVIWGFRKGSRSWKRKSQDRSRTLRCAKNLNRMPVPSLIGSCRPGVLWYPQTHDPYTILSIYYRDEIHNWGKEGELLQYLCCPKITISCLCFVFGIDCTLNQSLQNWEMRISSRCPFCILSLILFFPLAYNYSPKIVTVPYVCLPLCTLQSISMIHYLNFQSNLENCTELILLPLFPNVERSSVDKLTWSRSHMYLLAQPEQSTLWLRHRKLLCCLTTKTVKRIKWDNIC